MLNAGTFDEHEFEVVWGFHATPPPPYPTPCPFHIIPRPSHRLPAKISTVFSLRIFVPCITLESLLHCSVGKETLNEEKTTDLKRKLHNEDLRNLYSSHIRGMK